MKDQESIKIGCLKNKDSSPCCDSGNGAEGVRQKDATGENTCCPAVTEESAGYVIGVVATPAGMIWRVTGNWSPSDYWGQIKSRVSSFRMRYALKPGLYAIGEPGRDSDIFVSANYKLSFDILRKSVKELNAWILVLDTNGINVWCAAGKGTFATQELVMRIAEARLDKIVDHKKLVVPQLGAAGVNARTVQKRTGFRVYFGPVAAGDIPAYLKAGYTKTEEMRKVRFTIIDRLVLTPMEINPAMVKYPLFALIILLIFGLQPSGIFFRDAWEGGLSFLTLGLITVFSGAFLTPVLLPYIPFRSFAIKGWIMGMLSVLISLPFLEPARNIFLLIAGYLFFPLASSYIALQFTGSTTFTGMSGVKKELRIAIPFYLTGAAISLVLLAGYKLVQWEVI
ncbi:MAG: mercury methylation corrinoid protein HgcA [Syntrophales bacterium]|nr:mercury methylation corrinoid protein HgcA [Syntrophales bacterium]